MTPELIPAHAYVDTVCNAIDQATKRVASISLIFLNQSSTQRLISSLAGASRRGLSVEVLADFSTYSYAAGATRPASYFSDHVLPARSSQDILTKSGASFDWVGTNHVSMFIGRTHCKWIVVDDTVFTFGGMNISNNAISHSDFMFRTEDRGLADRLIHEQARIKNSDQLDTAYLSHSFKSRLGTVLIDGGIPGDSIIYRRACHLVEQAKSVCFVSQYCPSGRLGRAIKKIDHQVYFNRPDKLDILTKTLISLAQKQSGLTNLYSRKPYIHAKYLLVELPDGTTHAITGSHNFATAGVWAGTREIALETTDQAIISKLKDFTVSYIS